MTNTLYHYVHCPFCVRVRMCAGILNVPYKSKALAYDDIETPQKLIGKKMLPIMDLDGKIMSESLDIMNALDSQNFLHINQYQSKPEKEVFEKELKDVSNLVHSMAMPYWIYTPEFTESSRVYFQNQKEAKRGPFKDLVRNRNSYEEGLLTILHRMEFKPFYMSSQLRLEDILLSAYLWGMYIVPEFQFPDKVHSYLQLIKQKTKFDYHEDFWK